MTDFNACEGCPHKDECKAKGCYQLECYQSEEKSWQQEQWEHHEEMERWEEENG